MSLFFYRAYDVSNFIRWFAARLCEVGREFKILWKWRRLVLFYNSKFLRINCRKVPGASISNSQTFPKKIPHLPKKENWILQLPNFPQSNIINLNFHWIQNSSRNSNHTLCFILISEFSSNFRGKSHWNLSLQIFSINIFKVL